MSAVSFKYTQAERLADALSNLTRRIEAGEEFPDACWEAAARHCVTYEKLADAYDEAEAERGAA